ncbi:helix-turn-helix domain-containing protein [Denitromonas iodatirespirans]|uniref:Helix-turn-helix transcriptional regulator n=1 Tax=Denitromonas iodatirespirans TaxID=2795389 RepID=A0A944DAJ0_DENI1|nr:helix-turn-helix transcriptional regulator [Denitromonas iodatirespirans]MBT0962795.1 helix-turn-helix transcriptional regulator [Denitromonas iodatirespirans]
MSTTADLVKTLKTELKAAGLTYAMLAERLGLAESSVKRLFSASGDLPLSRIDAVCRVLGLDFADLARKVADSQPQLQQLSLEQEQAVVADRQLLLVAICVMSQMSLDEILSAYALSEAEGVRCLAQLDRLGIIDLRPGNRYHLKVAKGFRWLPQGPVMAFFRREVLQDYFAGGFDGESELLTVVHGEVGRSMAASYRDRLIRLCQDFSNQHLADQKLPADQRQPFTLVVGMRSWLMPALRDFQRPGAAS